MEEPTQSPQSPQSPQSFYIQVETGPDTLYQFGSGQTRSLIEYLREIVKHHHGKVVYYVETEHMVNVTVSFDEGEPAARAVIAELHEKMAPRMFSRAAGSSHHILPERDPNYIDPYDRPTEKQLALERIQEQGWLRGTNAQYE